MAAPRVSVIIPVYNDAEPLSHCLDALARQTFPHNRTEVIVVDNGSTQDIAAVVAQHLPTARLLHEARPGSYAARNRAIEAAAGDVLAFTDADCLPQPDWLEQGVAVLESDPGLALLAGQVDLFPRDPDRPTGAELYDMTYALRQRDYIEKEHFGVTANLFTRRATMDQVGSFNGALKSRGDYEWGRRVWSAGLRQAYSAKAVVRHPARPDLRTLAAKARRLRGGVIDVGELPASWGSRLRRWANHALPPRHIGRRVKEYNARYGHGAGLRFYGVFYYRRLVVASEEIRIMLGGRSRR